ncbi:tripartite tricarboxylate transporter TctB family protein [Vibrio algarum]|uniref:Tripartite tricarboxylate transporter TctB family protein n=1 Tax=Vibrio algarum TaxID=3020714 RepID=A0ABT4YUZ0_9VIBR|nr:tripartite tricarboxylate transporter TctB family protein [Vibrio sp. KJ40-1]MDB1124971.1 tripartite tricarboxylate transporter TctB family protein [Vibrio sp. KJ40-1]
MGEIIFHVFLLAVMGLFFNETLDINTARMTDPIGPAGFPQAVIILAVLLLVPSLYKAVKKYKESSQEEKNSKIKELDPGFIALLGTIVLFALTIGYVGFWFGAVVIISLVMFILNERKPKKLILTTVIASLAFTFVFGNILSIPLPRGIGIFESLSYLIY